MSGVKYADEPATVEDCVKVPKRGKSRVKKNQETKDQVLDRDTSSRPHIEPPVHDTLSSSLGADGAEKGNESPSSIFRNTPSVSSVSEAGNMPEEKEQEEDNEANQQSPPPPPLVLGPVITPGEVTKGSARAAYLGGRQNRSDVTYDLPADLLREPSARRRMQTGREDRLSCHPIMMRVESFVSSSSSDEGEIVGGEECASDFE